MSKQRVIEIVADWVGLGGSTLMGKLTDPIEVWLECPPTECETGIAPDCVESVDRERALMTDARGSACVTADAPLSRENG